MGIEAKDVPTDRVAIHSLCDNPGNPWETFMARDDFSTVEGVGVSKEEALQNYVENFVALYHQYMSADLTKEESREMDAMRQRVKENT